MWDNDTTALELSQGMESAAKNVRELTVPAQDLPSIAGPTAAAQNPINQVGDNAASSGTPPTGHYASSCNYKETVCN